MPEQINQQYRTNSSNNKDKGAFKVKGGLEPAAVDFDEIDLDFADKHIIENPGVYQPNRVVKNELRNINQ